jgi:hypothetical protein
MRRLFWRGHGSRVTGLLRQRQAGPFFFARGFLMTWGVRSCVKLVLSKV